MPVAFDVGDTVILQGDFTDADEQPADPEALTVTVEKPDGTVETLEASSEEVGIWTASVLADQSGTWWYRFAFTGDRSHAEESSFIVRRQRVLEEGS